MFVKINSESILVWLRTNAGLILIASLGFLVFFYTYWANIYRPGALTETGWYTLWADQQRYYEQARAIADSNLVLANFHYPILYPLLGSVFIKYIPRDPFFIVNAILFVSTLALTYLILTKLFEKQKAIFSIILLLSVNRFVYDFVTPWTTSVTAPLFMAVVYIAFFSKLTKRSTIVISFLTGLAFFARYADVLFFLPLIVGFTFKQRLSTKQIRQSFLISAGVFSGFIAIFVLLNQLISQSLLGPYIARNTQVYGFIFTPSVILEKTIGYFFNSFVLHRQIDFFSTPLISVFPIIMIVVLLVPFILYSLRQNSRAVRVTHISIMASFVAWLILHLTFDCCSAFSLKNLSLHHAKLWYPIGILYLFIGIDSFYKNYKNVKLIKFSLPIGMVLLFIPFLIHVLSPKLLESARWTSSASIQKSNISNVIDNNPETFWSTKRPRKTGDTIVIDLGEVRRVSRLKVVDDESGAATNFDTSLSTNGTTWHKLGPNYTYNVRREDGWEVLGYTKRGRYIQLVLNETSPDKPWIIREIFVFGY